jgi:Family of unknown function (DUF6308)
VVRRSFVARMSTIILRGGVELENPLELVLELLEAYSSNEAYDCSGPASFDEGDLRLANRGVARISATEIATILERRGEIERALRKIRPDASLADATSSIPWLPLTRLFDAFADIRGVGFSKTTKALHGKRTALIPMLDSVVQAYLTRDVPAARAWVVRGARHRARSQLQARPGSQPSGASRDPGRAGEPHLPAHRGANPRSPLPRVDPRADRVVRRDQLSQGNARREVAELASALRGPQELCEYMRLRSGIALPCGRQSPKGVAPCVSRTTA